MTCLLLDQVRLGMLASVDVRPYCTSADESHRLMAAAWAARCGINTRIIDKRGTKIFNGQADGMQCRTLEIFDSFGFADRIMKECNPLYDFWE